MTIQQNFEVLCICGWICWMLFVIIARLLSYTVAVSVVKDVLKWHRRSSFSKEWFYEYDEREFGSKLIY